jgi:hypothetical protein
MKNPARCSLQNVISPLRFPGISLPAPLTREISKSVGVVVEDQKIVEEEYRIR